MKHLEDISEAAKVNKFHQSEPLIV